MNASVLSGMCFGDSVLRRTRCRRPCRLSATGRSALGDGRGRRRNPVRPIWRRLGTGLCRWRGTLRDRDDTCSESRGHRESKYARKSPHQESPSFPGSRSARPGTGGYTRRPYDTTIGGPRDVCVPVCERLVRASMLHRWRTVLPVRPAGRATAYRECRQ